MLKRGNLNIDLAQWTPSTHQSIAIMTPNQKYLSQAEQPLAHSELINRAANAAIPLSSSLRMN